MIIYHFQRNNQDTKIVKREFIKLSSDSEEQAMYIVQQAEAFAKNQLEVEMKQASQDSKIENLADKVSENENRLNEKEDNVKADGLLMQEKEAEQKLVMAEKQAKEIIDAAYEEAERIKKEATSITVTSQQGEASSQSEQQQEPQTEEKSGKKK